MTTDRRGPLAWSLDGMVWAWREHASRDDIADALERASPADALAILRDLAATPETPQCLAADLGEWLALGYTRCFVRCHTVDAAPDVG